MMCASRTTEGWWAGGRAGGWVREFVCFSTRDAKTQTPFLFCLRLNTTHTFPFSLPAGEF